jgi:hypothetical protein
MQNVHSSDEMRVWNAGDFNIALAAFKCHFQTRDVPSNNSVRHSKSTVAQASNIDWRSEQPSNLFT